METISSDRNILLIGPAGNGKSFTTKFIIMQAMHYYCDLEAVAVCAPTHIAANGYEEGVTLQSLLGREVYLFLCLFIYY